MTPEAILECWEPAHQPLAPAQTIAFLSRPEIDELTGLPDDAVRIAIEQHPKLADILAVASVLAATTTLVEGASW